MRSSSIRSRSTPRSAHARDLPALTPSMRRMAGDSCQVLGARAVCAGVGSHLRRKDGCGRVCDRDGSSRQAARRLYLAHQGPKSIAFWSALCCPCADIAHISL
eukprot:2694839-Rhodomonas_salina.5